MFANEATLTLCLASDAILATGFTNPLELIAVVGHRALGQTAAFVEVGTLEIDIAVQAFVAARRAVGRCWAVASVA